MYYCVSKRFLIYKSNTQSNIHMEMCFWPPGQCKSNINTFDFLSTHEENVLILAD